MNLKAGKRYVLRNGKVTGPLESTGLSDYPFMSQEPMVISWTADGHELAHREGVFDIVSEYAGVDVTATVDAAGIGVPKPEAVRQFSTGATRNLDHNKLDYEGFLSPFALRRYAQYMHAHRVQADGTVRPGSNWKLGITDQSYMQSMWRHFMDVWENYSGITAVSSETGQPVSLEDSLCALLFNVHGMLHEAVKRNGDAK